MCLASVSNLAYPNTMKLLHFLLALAFAANPVVVEGTWSIIAIDKRTNQIGSAMATCLDSDRYFENAQNFLEWGFVAIPRRGGIIAQAMIQDNKGPMHKHGLPLLREDVYEPLPLPPAPEIIQAMANGNADPGTERYRVASSEEIVEYPKYELRQYGVVNYNLYDGAAGFTGNNISDLVLTFAQNATEAVHATVQTENYTISVQGNIVFPGTVQATLEAFQNSTTQDFAERLFEALVAGYETTGGDVRCAYNPNLKGAVLAILKVMEEDGTYSVNLEADLGESQATKSALDSIKQELEGCQRVWEPDNPNSTMIPYSDCISTVPRKIFSSAGTSSWRSRNSIVTILVTSLAVWYYL